MSCLNYWSTKEAVKLDQLIKISFKYLTLEQRHLALPSFFIVLMNEKHEILKFKIWNPLRSLNSTKAWLQPSKWA